MDEQIILGADENGKFSGEYFPKSVGHTGEGKHHFAITVLIYNSKGQVLLQRRKHKIFDNIWDVTGATHPLHRQDGSDETLEEATSRCLEVEYGIKDKIVLQNKGFFNYFAKYKGNLCENEYCAILVGEYNGKFNPNPTVSYGYKWISKKGFLKEILGNPSDYSPWAIACIPVLEKAGFFNE